MTQVPPTLHLVCGKIAAGKSTLTARLGAAPASVTISEDAFLAQLWPNEINTISDYVRCATRLRAAIGSHVVALLRAGLSVVLDAPANTRATRGWMRGLIDQAGARHVLHHLDVPDDLCLARLHQRNATGEQAAVSDEDFAAITAFFTPPAPEEGFNVLVHTP